MDKKQEKLVLKLYYYARRKLLYQFFGNFFILLLLLTSSWFSLTIADHTFYFSKITRVSFFVINFSIIIIILNKYFFQNIKMFFKLNHNSDFTVIALEIGKIFPEIRDELANTYNLMISDDEQNISQSLSRAAIIQTLQRYGDIDFKQKITLHDFLPKPSLYIPLIIGSLILFFFQSDIIIHSSKRLLNPLNDYLKISAYEFDVMPGNADVIKGSIINFRVRYNGPVITGGQVILDKDKRNTIELVKENEYYLGKISAVKKSFDYHILVNVLNKRKYGEEIISKVYHVKVLIPPSAQKFDVSITPPSYTSLPKEFLNRNIGDISSLPGSLIELKLTANKILKFAEIQFQSGKKIPLIVKGKAANGSFYLINDDRYKIVLQDTSGQININPIEYRLQTLPDNIPFVDITKPGEDIEVTPDIELPLTIKAEDDFGLTKAFLVYQILHEDSSNNEQEKKVRLMLNNNRENRQEIYYLWDFNKLPLAFGESIKYFARIHDNNNVSGPGIGKSRTYYIRFPSIDDIFDSFTQNENENIDEMKDVQEQSEDLKKKLEEIDRELKKNKKLDWQAKQKLEQSLEQQKELHNKVDKVQKDIEKMIEKLDKNNLISEEVLEKYMKLQEMFKDLASPELLEAMKQLQKQIDKSNPNDVQKALGKFKLNQEAFNESINRTMELLKQVQFEQQMDRLVQKSKSMTEQQKKISEKSKEKSPSEKDLKNLYNMQKQQEENLQSLHKDLQEFMKNPRLNKFNESKKLLNRADDKLQSGKMQEGIKQIEQNIANSDLNNAQKNSDIVQQDMKSLQKILEEAQKKINEQGKADVKKEILSIMKQMLELSKGQENLYTETNRSSDYSIRQRELAEKQGEILSNFQHTISDVIELSKKTFFIDPKISKSMARAQTGMQRSLRGLTERGQGSQAARDQQNAMAGLNDSFMKMQSSKGKLSKSSSGTGFEEFMEQLTQMADGQGQINEQSMTLCNKPGGMLPSQQQQMAGRLAAEQRALQQALEKMSGEMGNRNDMLGRIGDVAGEMEEVIQDLIKNNVNRKTIERQRQILSRLLDAQRSAQQREYSKKRKAEIAKQYNTNDPGEIKNIYDMDKKNLEEALNRALKEGYSQDYKKLIEKYFKTLENDN